MTGDSGAQAECSVTATGASSDARRISSRAVPSPSTDARCSSSCQLVRPPSSIGPLVVRGSSGPATSTTSRNSGAPSDGWVHERPRVTSRSSVVTTCPSGLRRIRFSISAFPIRHVPLAASNETVAGRESAPANRRLDRVEGGKAGPSLAAAAGERKKGSPEDGGREKNASSAPGRELSLRLER